MITKELQDIAWITLPKKYKEGVQKEFNKLKDRAKAYLELPCLSNAQCDNYKLIQHDIMVFNSLFGNHNLTADIDTIE